MRRAILLSLCVTLSGTSLARADLDKGTWAPEIEAKEWMNTDGEPISLAECRGMVVVLFFWVSWHAGGEAVMPLMTLVNGSRYGRAAGVFVIGLTDAERGRVEEMLKKEKVFFPVGLEAKKTVEDYRITTFPRVVIIDALGRVAWTGWPGAEGGTSLVEEIGKVLAATPPTRSHPEEAVRAKAYLLQARQALRDDKYLVAYEAANEAARHTVPGDGLRARAQDMADLVEAIGRDRLAQADRAVEAQEYDKGVGLLGELRRQFFGMDVARVAKRRLEALGKKHSEVQRILAEQVDAGQAEALLANALDQLRARKFGPAHEKLEQIANEYGDTEAATKARTVLERMKSNEAIMGYVRDYQASRPCKSLLTQVDTLLQVGKTNEARELLREILNKYPDTVYADDAAERLARLP